LARKVLEDIRQYGSPKRGWLGVSIRPVDNQAADAAGMSNITGIILDRVNEGSAAAKGGLQSGDIILSIDGESITSSPDFMGKIGQHPPGDILTFSLIRDKKNKEAKVTLSESKNGTTADIAS